MPEYSQRGRMVPFTEVMKVKRTQKKTMKITQATRKNQEIEKMEKMRGKYRKRQLVNDFFLS